MWKLDCWWRVEDPGVFRMSCVLLAHNFGGAVRERVENFIEHLQSQELKQSPDTYQVWCVLVVVRDW